MSLSLTNRGPTLLQIARDALYRGLRREVEPRPPSADGQHPTWLLETAATFVSLHLDNELRGCIGTLEAVRPLLDDVRTNALAAALEDPRFPPLELRELDAVTIEVTLLSQLEPMTFTSQEDALAQLRPGIDGVVLTYLGRRVTFLPQVWDSLQEPTRFVAELKLKGGMERNFWHHSIRLERYSAEQFREAAVCRGA